MIEYILFPYQNIGAAFLAGRDRAALLDEMGLGKSAQAITALDMKNLQRGIVVCPAAVREVWKGEFRKFSKRQRKIIKGNSTADLGLWLRGKADVLLLSYERATLWASKLEGDIFDFAIFDECFPHNTLVETEAGSVAIGDIVERQLPLKILCQGPGTLELRHIARYVKTTTRTLIRVRHSTGEFRCTRNHKIWTENRGFVAAENVSKGDILCVVRSGVRAAQQSFLQQKLFGELAQSTPPVSSFPQRETSESRCRGSNGETTSRCFGAHEALERRPGISRQSGRQIEVAERQVLVGPEGRERFRNETSDALIGGACLAGRVYGVGDRYRQGKTSVSFTPALLQSGHSRTFDQAGHRSGRSEPPNETLAFLGREENRGTYRSRVDSVEVHEQTGADGLAVYNLEIEQHHNYFADGALVSNCHYMKSDEAQRTRAMLGTQCDGAAGLARWAAYVWMLTGTAMPNDPADAWPMIRFMRGTPLHKPTFVKRYFKSWHGTFSSKQTPRADMVPELKQCFASFSLRRTLKDAGIDLPPIWLTTQTIDGDTQEICNLLRDHPGLEDAIIAAIEEGGLSFLDAPYISTLRRLIATAKAPAFVDLMDEDLKNGMNKVVIMGWHTTGLEMMHLEFMLRGYDVVLLTGNTNETDRKTAVRRFQEDPNCRIFIGNIKAAGTGITLTAASEIVMFELAWAPGDNAQALKRVHRIGQTDTVRARIICLENTIDETVAEIVSRKTASILQIEGQGVDVMEKLV